MKMSVETKQAKDQMAWDQTKYALNKTTEILLNPAVVMIAGFVAINLLENLKYGDVEAVKRSTGQKPWWIWLVPNLRVFVPDTQITEYTQKTVLSQDQANVLRTGLVLSQIPGTLQVGSNLLNSLVKVAPLALAAAA